ncbi:MAG: GntR family transcriptional regulator [Ktedonobacteraceae bacterium]|nr:GntR family transcriptional regulator [Ktedonobacteraceae bacterium]
MRILSQDKLLETLPVELREKSKTGQAYIEIRRKILLGEYQPDQIIIPREIEETYHVSNTSVQNILSRLAIEGLIKVLPIKRKTRATSAALGEYRVADLKMRDRMLTTRHGDFVSDVGKGGHPAYKETLLLKIDYADPEVAHLLDIAEGEKVIFHRNLQRRDKETVVCINDRYLPFWFVEMMPELEKPDSDVYELLRKLGKKPYWCTETVDSVPANTVERAMFGLSFDDPTFMFKIVRRSFDREGHPLEVQFLTDRGDIYRLHYSFHLYASDLPEALRDK